MLAKQLAETTGVQDLPSSAEAAGWLHDLGKYRTSFQEFIRGRSPMGSKQHKEAGAAFAVEQKDPLLMFAILGHHIGIPDKDNAVGAVKSEDGTPVWNSIREVAFQECPELSTLRFSVGSSSREKGELLSRVVLSCLVDADWTDTSEHERGIRQWPKFPDPPALQPADRLTRLLDYIDRRATDNRGKNPKLAAIRESILNACLTAAQNPSGLFSLTVPTGGGKTLSGLTFALKHAATHGLRRVIYVAPFISILEQNAAVISASLGVASDDLTVFEHQSLAEPQGPSLPDEKQTSAAARRAENWDSPVIITTNVQFFESLFSNKPGRCRKLHNIARSVIVLDECQTLPPELVKPTCQMLKQLTTTLGCTVMLCTATQPAFDHETLGEHQLKATEIIPKELDLFAELKRVTLEWPTDVRGTKERLSWVEVARRMTENHSALCIVNTKRSAIDLFEELEKLSQHVFHLSTSMCPAHRISVLAKAKKRLDAKLPVFVVSTQLIEAGVDIDFPCVFREMAPLESIIQAAGRCNREGLIPNAGGRVVVFRSQDGETKIPSGWYKKGRDVLEAAFLAANRQPSVELPHDIRSYFQHLYWQGELDKVIPNTLPGGIVGARKGFQFTTVADHYKLIEEDTVSVVVATWGEYSDEVERLLGELRGKPVRANFRALAPFQVNVFRHELIKLPKGLVVPVSDDIDLLVWYGRYDSQVGRTSELQDLIEAI